MTTPLPHMISRSGGHSAKNTHQTGAPNHLQGSGETPMVGTPPTTVPTVAHLQATLIAHKRRWLTSYPHLTISFTGLADVVSEILTVALATTRAINDELVREIVLLEAELAEARAERDQAVAESECRETEIIDLTVERDQAEAQASTLVNAADGEVSR